MPATTEVDHLYYRRRAMDDIVTPYEYRETDCSGRSLATLLVAWVSAAMVASVLLRWKYMWIALAVLTLLFLIACGYAACTTRRNIESDIFRSEAHYLEQRRRMEVSSVSGTLSSSNRNEPPSYQTYWITDLPPPYAVVTGELGQSEDQRVHSPPRLSNPPPYSIAVQEHPPVAEATDLSSALNNDNKTDASRSENTQNVLTTQYLSNLISNTFIRSPRSRDDTHAVAGTLPESS